MRMSQPKIFLVGLMAVGKTTIGRMLSEALQLPFYDSDAEIEARAGAEISWIFDMEGEEGFRDREESIIDELTQLDSVVLATGGGAVKRKVNREHLAARGTVIYLDCPLERLLARTSRDKKRPLLQGPNREKVLADLFCERAPLYAEIADYRFVSNEQSAGALVQQIVKRLRAEKLVK